MLRLSVRLRRQWLNLILAGVLACLTFDGIRGANGPCDLLILRYHSRTLTRERDRLVLDNAALRVRIIRLKSDDAYLQRLIRQELGYARPDEFVYRFTKSESPNNTSKPNLP
jgi:cell division protein FtsB